MKIQVEVSNEVLQAVMEGKYVEGSMRLQLNSYGTNKEVAFGAYNRLSKKKHKKDRIIKTLEHGWVKESVKQIKVYNSIPKKLGTKRIIQVLEREAKVAAEAIIDRDIINHV